MAVRTVVTVYVVIPVDEISKTQVFDRKSDASKYYAKLEDENHEVELLARAVR